MFAISALKAISTQRPRRYAEDRREKLKVRHYPVPTALVSTTLLHVSCNSAVPKVLIRLGKSLFLGSGKATTRAKHRITARVEGTGPSHRFPTRALRGNSAALLKLAEA